MSPRTALPHADRALIDEIRARLLAAAKPERAAAQQAYMKSTMPTHGIVSAGVKEIVREADAAHPLPSYESWHDTVLALFREATHREEWYTALGIAQRPSYRAYVRDQRSLPLYEELIVRGAWWDIVDEVSSHLLGALFLTDAAWMTGVMRTWSTDEVMWKRRASIICQLGRKEATDLDLLYACIEPNLADRQFFIRKAIGWALAMAARYEPEQIQQFIEKNEARLSGLSKRRALKNMPSSQSIESPHASY